MCAPLTVTDLKALRLVNRAWSRAGASHLLERVFLSASPQSYKDLEEIALNGSMRSGVTTLVVDSLPSPRIDSFVEWNYRLTTDHYTPVWCDFRPEWPRRQTPPELLTHKAREAFQKAQAAAPHTIRQALDEWQRQRNVQAAVDDESFAALQRRSLTTFMARCDKFTSLVVTPVKRSASAYAIHAALHKKSWPLKPLVHDHSLCIDEQTVWSTFLHAAVAAKRRITMLTVLDVIPNSPRACPQYIASESLRLLNSARLLVILKPDQQRDNSVFATYLVAAPMLTSLTIRAIADTSWQPITSLVISHILAQATWPQLKHLSLTKCTITEEILTSFLLRHAGSLVSILFDDLTLTTGSWIRLLSRIAGQVPSTTRFEWREHFRSPSASPNAEMHVEFLSLYLPYGYYDWSVRSAVTDPASLESYVLEGAAGWDFRTFRDTTWNMRGICSEDKGRVMDAQGDEHDAVFQWKVVCPSWETLEPVKMRRDDQGRWRVIYH